MQRTLFSAIRPSGRVSRFRVFSASLAIAIAAVATAGISSAATTETILHDFTGGSDGGYPDGPLVFGPGNGLYGTTVYGGTSNNGTVFELVPPTVSGGAWTETVLYNFTGGFDGAHPAAGLIFDGKGSIYGTAEATSGEPYGVVFKLTPSTLVVGTFDYSMIYNFNGQPDGGDPNSTLVFDAKGDLYGTTTSGGASNLGTVFKLVPPVDGIGAWSESVLHSFAGASDGASPYANLVFGPNSVVYGTTTAGGKNASGTVFSLTPNAKSGFTFATLYEFKGSTDGSEPYAPVTVGANGAIFGTTFFGGSGYGVIFQLAPPTGVGTTYTETVIHSFNGSDGANPSAGLISDGKGGLYGTTAGGVVGYGNVFHLIPPVTGTVWTETVIYSFLGTGGDAQAPLGALVKGTQGVLFDATYYGGAYGEGTVVQIQ